MIFLSTKKLSTIKYHLQNNNNIVILISLFQMLNTTHFNIPKTTN